MNRRIIFLLLLSTALFTGCIADTATTSFIEEKNDFEEQYCLMFGADEAIALQQGTKEEVGALLLTSENVYTLVDLESNIAFFYDKSIIFEENPNTKPTYKERRMPNYYSNNYAFEPSDSGIYVRDVGELKLIDVAILPDIQAILSDYVKYLEIYGEDTLPQFAYNSNFSHLYIQENAVISLESGYYFDTTQYPPRSLLELLQDRYIVSAAASVVNRMALDSRDLWYISREGEIVLLRFNGNYEVIPCA